MKNKVIVFSLVLATLAFSACKKDLSPSVKGFEPWVFDETLPVPIEFGKSSGFGIETKAAVTTQNLYSIPFGIYGVDLENNVSLFTASKSHLAKCESSENIMQFVNDMKGEVQHLYYPINTKKDSETRINYTFYGYHTGSADVEGFNEQTTNAYCKTVNLDDVDVLWAKAVATPIEDPEKGSVTGFNSDYSRTAKKQSNPDLYYPQLNFKHVTTAFHIKVKAADAEAAASFLEQKVRITKVALTNVDSKAKLIISDKNTPSREGTLESMGEAKVDLERNDLNIVPTVEGAELGDGFFVLPGAYSDSDLKFTLETDPEGTPEQYSCKLPLPAGVDAFEAAKSYTFTIIVKSFNEIIIKASLNEWEDGFTQDDLNEQTDVIKVIE